MSTTAVERVQCAFDEGSLLHPLGGDGNTVDLAQAMSSLAGAPVDMSAAARHLCGEIGRWEHYVFVLVDGLGMNLVDQLGSDSWLRRHVSAELRAVFPSSTAPALTSIATAAWPAEHAVLGWWLYLPDPGHTATILPFVERFSERPLDRLSVTASYAFPLVARPAQFTYHFRAFAPATIAASTYSRYASADAPYYGYMDLHDAAAHVARRVRAATGPTYSYWYISQIDMAEHTYGVGSPQAAAALQVLQACLLELEGQVGGRARIVVTADHGQINVGQKHVLDRSDPLISLMSVPPTGDPRAPLLHAAPGRATELASAFERAFESLALLSIDEAEDLRLFGPHPLSGEARRRAGDFVAVALDDAVLMYEPNASLRTIVGVHAGLHPDEMRVPLVLA